jgi:hydroxymethylglutaryl-CoA lyase
LIIYINENGAGIITPNPRTGFSRKNTNCSVDEGLARLRAVCTAAAADGVRVRGYISCVVGCPFDGEVAPAQVAGVSRALLEMGCYEVSLGDTIGVGTAGSVGAMLDAVPARARLLPVI